MYIFLFPLKSFFVLSFVTFTIKLFWLKDKKIDCFAIFFLQKYQQTKTLYTYSYIQLKTEANNSVFFYHKPIIYFLL